VELALKEYDMELSDEIRIQAVRFATQRGSRSGRIANQFATFWFGQNLD
jgi:predicted AAA+ superfamily ATPase